MIKNEQKHEKVKLKSGMEVHFLFDKRFTTSSIQMCFKVGWRNDPVDQLGLAHLFEHLVGKRTEKYPGKSEFMRKLDELGIINNAHTGPDMTVYYQDQTNENLQTSLSLMLESIYKSKFDKEDLEKEKEVVLTEAREFLDNDEALVWRKMIQNLFPETSLQKFFFGDRETMARIKLSNFEDFYKLYTNPKNSVLFVATNNSKSKQKIVGMLNKYFSENKNILSKENVVEVNDVPAEVVPSGRIEKIGRSQSEVRVGFRLDAFSNRERIVFGVVNSLLLGGFAGKIIQKVRDEMGLIYWMSLNYSEFINNLACIYFSFGSKRDKRDLVVEKIFETVAELVSTLTQEDIDKTIPSKVYAQQLATNPHTDLEELLEAIFYKRQYIQSKEYIKTLKDIKVQEVKKMLSNVFNRDKMSVNVIE